MATGFAKLMAMSASQTAQSDAATQQILAEKRRKEEQRKKEQLEKERKDREAQALVLKRQLDADRLAEERKRKAEDERLKKEAMIAQKEEANRKKLLYGPQKRSGWGSGSGGGGGGGRSRKGKAGSDDEDTGTQILTREEKRMRRLNLDMSKTFASTRRGGGGFSSPLMTGAQRSASKAGPSTLAPRGALNTNGGASSLSRSLEAKDLKSVRKQLEAMAGDFGKNGNGARLLEEFDTARKKAARAGSGDGDARLKDRDKRSLPALKNGRLDASRSRSPEPGRLSKAKEQRTKITTFKPDAKGSISFSKSTNGCPSANSTKQIARASSNSIPQKRAHSYSAPSDYDSDEYDSDNMDMTPPPSKRRLAGGKPKNDISSEIWKIFGKDRSRYMANDVFSDEEDDMEVNADALRREELRSERIAKREDELALEEEKRHEEMKRRKKKEKERMAGH